MNQKGFATIFGLCLILIIALMAKGIQEAEGNHSYETSDFQIEFDLQNAADSGIYEAVKIIYDNPNDILKFNTEEITDPSSNDRKKYQKNVIPKKTIKTSSNGDISVEVWAERILMYPYRVNYNKYDSKKQRYIAELVDASKPKEQRKAYTLFSKAELDSERIGGKLYRRSFAYVELDGDGKSGKTIHFMDIANDYTYKPESP